MKIIINNLAWFKLADIDEVTLHLIRNDLTIIPKTIGAFNQRPNPIYLFAMNDKWLGMPRPYYFNKAKKLFKQDLVEEYRISGGTPLSSLETNITLRPEDQEPLAQFVVDYCKQREYAGGAIEAFTSFGKTITMFEIIKRIGLNTLVILHRENLVDQWKRSLSKFWPQATIGRIQGNLMDYKKDITFAMLQTLMTENNDKFPKGFFNHFGLIVVDECLEGSTLVATASGHKKIEEINIGDWVLSPSGKEIKVINKKVSTKKTAKYIYSCGRYLIASENHIVVTNPIKHCNGIYNKTKEEAKKLRKQYYSQRILLPISQATKLEGFESVVNNREFVLEEYFVGWFVGDGFIDKYRVRFQFKKQEKIEIFEKLLKELGFKYRKIYLKRGDVSFEIREQAILLLSKYGIFYGQSKKIGDKFVPEVLFNKCSIGFLRGIYDTDGCCSDNKVEFDTACQRLCESVFKMLSSLGICCYKKEYYRNSTKRNPLYRILIGAKKSINLFKNLIGFTIPFKKDRLELIKESGRNLNYHYLCEVIDNGEQIVYDIEVDSKDHLFIANGLLVHNCHIMGAEKFGSVLPKFSNKYTLMLSGTLYRQDGCENVFKYCGGDIIIKASEQNRIRPTVYVMDTKFVPNKPVESKISALALIENSRSRNQLIAVDIVKAVKANRYPLVMSERLDQLRGIREAVDRVAKLNNIEITHGMFIGGKTERELEKASNCRVVYATIQLAKEGVDVVRLDTLFLVSPVSSIEQISGRICRRAEGKLQPYFLDYVDLNIGVFKTSFINRYKMYKNLQFEVKGTEGQQFGFLDYVKI